MAGGRKVPFSHLRGSSECWLVVSRSFKSGFTGMSLNAGRNSTAISKPPGELTSARPLCCPIATASALAIVEVESNELELWHHAAAW